MSGGEMAKMGLDHCLVVGSSSIHRIQECHVLIYHMLWDLVHTLLADDRGNLAVGAADAEEVQSKSTASPT
jgi:D-sedoheptulose 7-phosphate isomerase